MLKGKVFLVTGASSGIGRATALIAAERGADCVITGRNSPRLNEVEARIEAMGRGVLALPGELTDDSFRTYIVHKTRSRFGRLDGLVNAAGIIATGTLESTALTDLRAMMALNVEAVFHLGQLALTMLRESGGSIVNVSSVTGLRAFPGILAYSVSKAAVDQLTRCMALELASDGIRVNAVNPGVVRTNLHRAGGMDEKAYAAFLEHSKETHPLGRVGEPEEVAELILFLLSEKAGWITGDTIAIDGGRAQTCAR